MQNRHEVCRCLGCGEPTTYPNGKVRMCECEREMLAEHEAMEREYFGGMGLAEFFESPA